MYEANTFLSSFWALNPICVLSYWVSDRFYTYIFIQYGMKSWFNMYLTHHPKSTAEQLQYSLLTLSHLNFHELLDPKSEGPCSKQLNWPSYITNMIWKMTRSLTGRFWLLKILWKEIWLTTLSSWNWKNINCSCTVVLQSGASYLYDPWLSKDTVCREHLTRQKTSLIVVFCDVTHSVLLSDSYIDLLLLP